MATVTFTNAEIDFLFASGYPGNWTAAAGTFTSMEGDSGVVPWDMAEVNPTIAMFCLGFPHDDGTTVPPVITMTNVNIVFDWAVANVIAAGGDVSFIDAGTTITQQNQASGIHTGTYNADFNPATYFGGTDRAALYGGGVLWSYGWISPLAGWTSGRVAVSSYVATVTYTVPTPPEVTSIHPRGGSVNGGQAVTIRGTGFTGAPSASVGGVALTSFSVVDDETITGVTGEHLAGVVDVDVSGVGTLTDGYTYVIPPTFRLDPLLTRTPIAQGGSGGARRGR